VAGHDDDDDIVQGIVLMRPARDVADPEGVLAESGASTSPICCRRLRIERIYDRSSWST